MRLIARLSRLLWVPVALGVLTHAVIAEALPIQVASQQYTVTISAYKGPPAVYVVPTRTTTSPTPITDTLRMTITDGDLRGSYFALASADFFGVEARTAAGSNYGGNGRSSARAMSVVAFSPIADGIATLDFTFVGSGRFDDWSSASLRLEDLTTGDVIWEDGKKSLSLPSWWPRRCCSLVHDAALSVEQPLNATHDYVLTMSTGTSAADDSEGMSIHVSGLQPVPEPSCVLLIIGGMLATGVGRSRHRRRSA